MSEHNISLSSLNTDLSNISKLSDMPTPREMEASDLKAVFDKAGNDIKGYINNTLIPQLVQQTATKDELAGVVTGEIPDYSVTKEKLNGTLSSEIDNIYGVENNLSKALLYPALMSEEEKQRYYNEPIYTSSQIASILNDIEELTKNILKLNMKNN